MGRVRRVDVEANAVERGRRLHHAGQFGGDPDGEWAAHAVSDDADARSIRMIVGIGVGDQLARIPADHPVADGRHQLAHRLV